MWSKSELLWVSFETLGVTGAVGTGILTALGYCGVLILAIVIGFICGFALCSYKVNKLLDIQKDLIKQQKVKIENHYHLHLHGEMPYKKRNEPNYSYLFWN